MASTLKSVRIDNNVLDLLEKYRALKEEMFGVKLSIADVVNVSIPEYIAEETLVGRFIEPDTPIVSVGEHGRMQQISFSEEICNKLKAINDTAVDMSHYYEESRIRMSSMTADEIIELAENLKINRDKSKKEKD